MEDKNKMDGSLPVENMENEETKANNESPVAEEPNEVEKLKTEVTELKDKYLRLYSEFENFRRRTSKEKLDLIKTANEDLLLALVPVIDDFERADKSLNDSTDTGAVKEGVKLIYNKLFKLLESMGLKAMESSIGKEFNSELQEAIGQAPAPSETLKGKIIDEVEKGYTLNDKVVRFAKVIIGS
jgi:molecular chaperone GrpE